MLIVNDIFSTKFMELFMIRILFTRKLITGNAYEVSGLRLVTNLAKKISLYSNKKTVTEIITGMIKAIF